MRGWSFDRRRLRFPVPRGNGAHGFGRRQLPGCLGAAVRGNSKDVPIRNGGGGYGGNAFYSGTAAVAPPTTATAAVPALFVKRHDDAVRRRRRSFRHFGLRMNAVHRNACLCSLDHLLAVSASSAAPAPAAVTAFMHLTLRNHDRLGRLLRFCLHHDGAIRALLLLGDGCDADRRAGQRVFGGFFGEFAQLLRRIRAGDFFTALAATAALAFGGRRSRQFSQRKVVFNIDDLDACGLPRHAGGIFDFDDASVDNRCGRSCIRQPSRKQFDFLLVTHTQRAVRFEIRNGAHPDLFRMYERIDANVDRRTDLALELLDFVLVPELQLRGNRRCRLDQ